MVKPIYLYGSKELRKISDEVDISSVDEIKELVNDLKDTLRVAEGCGLAAPQIGVNKRVLIVDGSGLDDMEPGLSSFKRTMINPVVLEESEEMCDYSEGCLSIPGVFADVTRPASIIIEFYDENFEKIREKLTGFACRMVQHELSHLNGELFVDMVSPIRKKIISKKLTNISGGKTSTSYKTKIK